MKLNIRQIEVFAAVMEHGSTVAAANKLRVSQPSVSKHLKLLEWNTGVSLFVRKNNRLIATPEAVALHEEIKRTYVGISHLEDFAVKLSSAVKMEFGIAAMSMISQRWLPQVVAKFLREHDHFSFSMSTRTHQTIGTWVASGRADLGICMEVADNILVEQELLLQLPIVCALLPNHRKAGRSTMSSRDLNGETLITLQSVDDWKAETENWRIAVQNKLNADKVKPRNMVTVSTSHEACELVWRGLGITLVDGLTAMDYQEKGVKCVPFDFDYTFDVYLILPKVENERHLIADFLDVLRLEAKKLNAEVGALHPNRN